MLGAGFILMDDPIVMNYHRGCFVQGDAGELCQHPEDGRPEGTAEEVQTVHLLQERLCRAPDGYPSGEVYGPFISQLRLSRICSAFQMMMSANDIHS